MVCYHPSSRRCSVPSPSAVLGTDCRHFRSSTEASPSATMWIPAKLARRTPLTSSHRRSEDRACDVPRSSVSSGFYSSAAGSSSPASYNRNPVRIAVLAVTSCFASPEPSLPTPADESVTTSASTQGSSQGSSQGSLQGSRRRGMGMSSGGRNSSRREPGGTSLTIAEIMKATKNFSPSLKIGQGGSGIVYRGQLDDGTVVAVKRTKKNTRNSLPRAEFQNEIRTLARIEHQNLVRLHGFLEHQDERIVVVEYVTNGTLREHLDCKKGKILDLASRLDIAIDVAHAVTYLHMYSDNPIIHRDIKSSNILLSDNLRAKVADFGFARLLVTESDVTHISTQVKGTAGYLDPEYLQTYQLTEKSDVYSFGVLLVELVSGRRPIETKRQYNERLTVKWAMKKFTDGNWKQILDPNLRSSVATKIAMEKILELALLCLAPTKNNRPSMRRCAEILWTIRKDHTELLSSSHLVK